MNDRITLKALAVAAVILLWAGTEPLSAQGGTQVYDFLRADASARAASMAGSFITVPSDPVGIFYNPALLETAERTEASFTAFKHVLDINSGYLAATTSLDGIGPVGAGVAFTSYGAFDKTDVNGNQVGEFGATDVAFLIGWGSAMGEGFSAGVAGKAIFSTIDDYSSMALALDGGLYYTDTSSNIQAGASLRNLGSQLSAFGEETEPLPIDLSVGVSHNLRGLPLLVALNLNGLLDDEDIGDRLQSFTVGGEFTLSEALRLRLGYDNRVRQNISFGASKGLAGLSAGIGVLVSEYRIDYGFSSLSGIGSLHRFTVNAQL